MADKNINRKRPRNTSLLLAALLVLVVNLPLLALVFAPATDEPQPTDAIFVLGPPDASRLNFAASLAEKDPSTTVVISATNDGGPGSIQHNRLCTATLPYRVICARSEPFTTQGEIALLGDLAATHNWQSVTLVTSTTHASRVRLYAARCLSIHYRITPDPDAALPHGALLEYPYQLLGFVKAFTLTRGCA